MNTTSTSRRARSLAAIFAAAALVAACGDSDDAADDAPAETEASTAEAPDADETDADEADADAAETVEVAPVAIDGDTLPSDEESENDLAIGAPAPVVSGQTFDGSAISIGGPTENATFVVFLAHWCPACNAELPELVQLAEADAYPEGLDVIAVATASTDERDNFPPSQWLADAGWTFPAMVDSASSEAFLAFGGVGFPYGVVLDAEGNVLSRHTGPQPADEISAFLDAALNSAAS